MANLTKTEPKSALVEAGQSLLHYAAEKAEIEKHEKALRAFILQGMKKNRIKSLTLEDGTIFTIKAGSRKVIIRDDYRREAEDYLEEKSCWKLDSAKLLAIFGRELKVPKFFRVERGPELLSIMPPRAVK
jgi:hypothetical protein